MCLIIPSAPGKIKDQQLFSQVIFIIAGRRKVMCFTDKKLKPYFNLVTFGWSSHWIQAG